MKFQLFIFNCLLLALSIPCHAAKLAIVIDDFGYRKITEQQALTLPLPVTIAILPSSPLHAEMEASANAQGREVIIHMPMAPISKQPLEADTLTPTMSKQEIARILQQAMVSLPSARGMNNHMGSAMTADLAAMKTVFHVLAEHNFYFLDSATTAKSQVKQAAEGTSVKLLKRDVFLDDTISEENTHKQLLHAFTIARKQGYAIAIGHPHPSTIKVLQQTLTHLPADIELVTLAQLIHDLSTNIAHSSATKTELETSVMVTAALFAERCPIEIPDNFKAPTFYSILFEWLSDQIKHYRDVLQQQELESNAQTAFDAYFSDNSPINN